MFCNYLYLLEEKTIIFRRGMFSNDLKEKKKIKEMTTSYVTNRGLRNLFELVFSLVFDRKDDWPIWNRNSKKKLFA